MVIHWTKERQQWRWMEKLADVNCIHPLQMGSSSSCRSKNCVFVLHSGYFHFWLMNYSFHEYINNLPNTCLTSSGTSIMVRHNYRPLCNSKFWMVYFHYIFFTTRHILSDIAGYTIAALNLVAVLWLLLLFYRIFWNSCKYKILIFIYLFIHLFT